MKSRKSPTPAADLPQETVLPLSDQLRNAIRTGSKTRYRIALDNGISPNCLNNFAAGNAGLGIQHIDSLFSYLGFQVVRAAKPVAVATDKVRRAAKRKISPIV